MSTDFTFLSGTRITTWVPQELSTKFLSNKCFSHGPWIQNPSSPQLLLLLLPSFVHWLLYDFGCPGSETFGKPLVWGSGSQSGVSQPVLA